MQSWFRTNEEHEMPGNPRSTPLGRPAAQKHAGLGYARDVDVALTPVQASCASVPEGSGRHQIHHREENAGGDEGEMDDDPPFEGRFIERLVANFQEAPQQRDC